MKGYDGSHLVIICEGIALVLLGGWINFGKTTKTKKLKRIAGLIA